ncbi:hypothetical protein RHGRI_031102 [Rhododendron griersonianum]|uniref:Uncharacterized protein n=1 Tax=Rhododendron griersonianum TaxID=479676 RepID=A0AAV6I958_9ERIC|nr:hypothetical protein RHGRI_031102 [Rhododendron griersonianum]
MSLLHTSSCSPHSLFGGIANGTDSGDILVQKQRKQIRNKLLTNACQYLKNIQGANL